MEMMERYEELYSSMATAKDPAKMQVFGNAEKWVFGKVMESHPDLAKKWLEKLEAGEWNNYLAEYEAADITAKLVNQNGKIGAVWNMSQVESAVDHLGGKMCDVPYYNNFALFTTMNMIASDHMESMRDFIADEEMPRLVYLMSVEKLKDKDRPKFIRDYFKV